MSPSEYAALTQDEPEASTAVSANPLRGPKPETYYGEGPFDPPSSDDEADDLLDNQDEKDAEWAGNSTASRPRSRLSPLRILLYLLGSLVALSLLLAIYVGLSYGGMKNRNVRGQRHILMDHVFNRTFFIERERLDWVPEGWSNSIISFFKLFTVRVAGDGVFGINQDDFIKLVDLKTNQTRNLVAVKDLTNERGEALNWAQWKLSPDMKYILVKADYKKQWRHSSFGNYYVHDLANNRTHPLTSPSDPPTTAYATWSPTGETIAFVQNNDIYILLSADPSEEPIRITNTGTASFFNGVPDWCYEEEIFSSDFTLFFSPSSTLLAFLSFDEEKVNTFSFPIYNPTADNFVVVPYTQNVNMKYPKPGYNNPIVSLHVFDVSAYRAAVASGEYVQMPSAMTMTLDWEGRHAANDSVIEEVKWVGNDTLVMKEVNRNSDKGNVVLFDLGDRGHGIIRSQGRVVRKLGKEGEEGDDGWIDHSQSIYPLPPSYSPDGVPAYLDVVPTKDGYDHIALFNPATASEPIWLTSGNWEVTGSILKVDPKLGLVYFQAAHPVSTERNIYSVKIPTDSKSRPAEPTSLTNSSVPSFYMADFSPEAGFYLLSYNGPNVPRQEVVKVNDTDFHFTLTENEHLNKAVDMFEMPVVLHSTLDNEGYELNVKEIRPPRMDESGRTKYPVLFHVYGGPASQTVDAQFKIDWHYHLASVLEYVIVEVDGRGTGFKGRRLRNAVKGNLGFFETRDQIAAARIWAEKPYVDRKRIGIWGWSFGGFMSTKVVEAAAGIHSLALAVAPVTSWLLYDSIYTERYMNLPALNPSGYINASISNVTGFHSVDFLLAHGSGDDNVHFANSAHLLDMFVKDKVRNFRFRMFPDSDHSINKRGAYRELHEWMVQFLREKWGKGGGRRN